MNKASQTAVKNGRFASGEVPLRLMALLDETLDKLIDEKYNGLI